MPNKMPKATIKSSTGAVITIEGTHEEVSRIISDFERSTSLSRVKKDISTEQHKKRVERKRLAATDLIVELRDEGFFDKPKTLVEIAQKLEEKGRITPVTSLSGLMMRFVQQRVFGRKKTEEGKWGYVK